eukprot:gene5733-6434_t
MDSRTRPAVFASPNSKFKINDKKRKCSFGSAEKGGPGRKDRKQNRGIFKELTNENLEIETNLDFEYSPCMGKSWADMVEFEEKTEERAKVVHSKRHLELHGQRTNESNENKKKSNNNSLGRKLQPILTDPHRINQRQKQLDMGKNTLGYETYIKAIQRSSRQRDDPWTPDKYQLCSTRSWQGQVKSWRRRLHIWDPEDNSNHHDPFSTSISFNSEGDTVHPDSDVFQDSFSGTCSSQSSEGVKHSQEDNACFDEEVFGRFTMENTDPFEAFPI